MRALALVSASALVGCGVPPGPGTGAPEEPRAEPPDTIVEVEDTIAATPRHPRWPGITADCPAPPPPPGVRPYTDVLEATIEGPFIVARGAPVEWVLTLHNPSPWLIRAEMQAHGQHWTLRVHDIQDNPLWDSRFIEPGAAIADVAMTVRFCPGDEMVDTIRWDQRPYDPEPLGPGVYRITAEIGTTEQDDGTVSPRPTYPAPVSMRRVLVVEAGS